MTAKKPLVFDDLLRMVRAREPRVSPDGRFLVFVGVRPDLEANKNDAQLYRVELATGDRTQLTHQGSSNADPAWSPDGAGLAFTSNRSGESQVWVLPSAGGEARQVTRFPLGASRPVWFPDSKRVLVHGPTYAEAADPQAAGEIHKKREDVGGHRILNDLMFRHWDTWVDDQVDHLYVVDVETGEARDLTPGPYPVPPRSLTGDPDYAVSPDGKEVAYVCLRDDAQAVSTSIQVWTVPAEGGDPKRVSTWDGLNAFPVYSPDGSRLAFVGMRRAGYEADLTELLILDRASGEVREVAPGFDRSVNAPVWTPDGKHLVFSAEDQGSHRVYSVPASGGGPKALTGGATDHDPVLMPDGSAALFARETAVTPPEIHRVALAGGDAENVAPLNAEVLGEFTMNDAEDFWFEGARGARVHGMLFKPPGFEEGRKYPVVFLIHGGPQSAFGRDFHERWNTQLFAAKGWITVTINPRGSTGYGQEFTDAIRGEWGGACYEDLERGFDYVLDTYDFCDRERTAAAGASFGGYMVNWINGQTDRFKTLVCHDGIFNTEMMEYATEELWFTEWEFGGLPWESPEEYRKWSPHSHAGKMKTPMLIIHSEQDFRCVSGEGFTLFTALRRQDVPAKMLWFPDEGHWVLKPKNRKVWWTEVLGWLESYLG